MQTPANQPEEKRRKLWLIIRIENYGLQFLTTAEEWEGYSAETIVSFDREEAYQAARRNQGLLCRADAVMSAGQASALKERVRAATGISAQPRPHGDVDADPANPEDEVCDNILPEKLRNPRGTASKVKPKAKEQANELEDPGDFSYPVLPY